MLRTLQQFAFQSTYYTEQNLYPSPLVRPCKGGSHVTRLNFKTSCVSVYKCLSLIVGFALTVPICWPREVVSCHDFILHTVPTFWAMLLVGIYPGRASLVWLGSLGWRMVYRHFKKVTYPWQNWDKKIMVKAIMYIVVLYIYIAMEYVEFFSDQFTCASGIFDAQNVRKSTWMSPGCVHVDTNICFIPRAIIEFVFTAVSWP